MAVWNDRGPLAQAWNRLAHAAEYCRAAAACMGVRQAGRGGAARGRGARSATADTNRVALHRLSSGFGTCRSQPLQGLTLVTLNDR